MIILGVILLVLGVLLGVSILWTLGIILLEDAILTICAAKGPALQEFLEGRIKDFSTARRSRFEPTAAASYRRRTAFATTSTSGTSPGPCSATRRGRCSYRRLTVE